MIVAAALDTPGIKDKHCAQPILKACIMLISFVVFVLILKGRFSIAIITMPPKMSASDT